MKSIEALTIRVGERILIRVSSGTPSIQGGVLLFYGCPARRPGQFSRVIRQYLHDLAEYNNGTFG